MKIVLKKNCRGDQVIFTPIDQVPLYSVETPNQNQLLYTVANNIKQCPIQVPFKYTATPRPSDWRWHLHDGFDPYRDNYVRWNPK